jgi:hypothetical protein
VSHAPRRLLALCTLFALTLALAACGSSSSKATNEYVSQVNAIQNEVAAQFRTAGGAILPTSSVASDQQALTRFDQAVTNATAKLKAVKAPEKVKSLHADLVTEVDSYHQSIAAARLALSAKSQAAVSKAQGEFASGTAQTSAAITTTIDAINRKLHE